MIKASAPGNIFLLGEHSVVYERPALLASLDRRTYVSGEKRNDEKVVVDSKDYGKIESDIESLGKRMYESQGSYTDEMDPLRHIISYFHKVVNDLDRGFEAEIKSEIPKDSGGQSSSTAVLTSFFYFLNELYGGGVVKGDYFTHLYPFQVKIHGGAASGSEFASSIFGGYNRVVKTPDGERPVEFENLGSLELDLVIGDTGIVAKTDETVSKVRKNWQDNKKMYESYFNSIAHLVGRAEKAIEEENLEELGYLMDENQRILSKQLEVSHPKLEELIGAARKAGAYGAKLSGGGGGGIMVALCDESNKKDIRKVIEENGGEACVTEVGVQGVMRE
ncbi:MAG: mevalonate kinase [Candidatus Aenigmatarchaeota archaeon]